MRAGGVKSRRSRTRDTVDDRITRCAANDCRSALLNRTCLASDQLELVDLRRRVVDRGNENRHGHFRAGADLIGGRRGRGGNPLVVDRDQFKRIGEGFAAVVGVNQISGSQLRRRDFGADAINTGDDGHAIQR